MLSFILNITNLKNNVHDLLFQFYTINDMGKGSHYS